MRTKLLFAGAASAFIVTLLLFPSCKKDDSGETYQYMTGEVDYMFPAYTVRNQYIVADASGILAPTDVQWYWYSAKLKISTVDTIYGTHLEFSIPDSLGDYTLTAAAKKDGYYTKSKTCTTKVIDTRVGGESVKGFDLSDDSTFVDARDGQKYTFRRYGELYWFTMNLNYAGTKEEKVGAAYQESDSIGVLFGRLYSWEEATGGATGSGLGHGPQGLCPEGWSVPTKDDWVDFAVAVADTGRFITFDDKWEGLAPKVCAPVLINDDKFWPYSPNSIPTNECRWNAMPTGKSANGHETFECLAEYGFWWSSEKDTVTNQAIYRYIYYDTDEFRYSSTDPKNIGFSVRCVKRVE